MVNLASYCLLLTVFLHNYARVQSQTHSYPTQHQFINHHNAVYSAMHPVSGQMEAEDRHIHWLKHLKKKKKKKLKFFKKHMKKCGLPFKFKLIKKVDDDGDDLDTVQIKLPYGFGDEYYPNSVRKADPVEEETEDDDDDDDDDDEEQQSQRMRPIFHNQLPFYRPIMRPMIPPFKPIRGPIPAFNFQRFPPRRPAVWRFARPSLMPSSYVNEPIPGLFRGSPPSRPLFLKEKHIPLSTTKRPPSQKQEHIAHSNPTIYNAHYSQLDFPLLSYQVSTSTEARAEDDKVVTVTPSSSGWPFNSPVYNSSILRDVRKLEEGKSAMKDDDGGEFRIIVVDEPEIITAKYQFDGSDKTPFIITKDNMGLLKPEERVVNFDVMKNGVVDGNTSRIRRSKIEGLSATVSDSMTVKD